MSSAQPGARDPYLHAAARDEPPVVERSLIDDIEALIDDGRTYVSAELTYQKTRASFVADRLKKAIAFGVVAAVFALLAAIGLTVGLIIALTPLITGWGATAVVVGAELLVAYLMVSRAARNWGSAMSVMGDQRDRADARENG